MKNRIAVFVAAALFVCGCGAAAVPGELLNARSTYGRASTGSAVQFAPVQLRDAQLALDRAERSFDDHGASMETRDLAYIAQRRAELAEVDARTEFDQRIAHATTAERQTLLAQLNARQRQELLEARTELTQEQQARTQAELQAQDAVAQQQQAQAGQAQAQQQAADEHDARIHAEDTARAALESLRQVANVREDQRGTVVTLSGSILFASGASTLLPIAQQRLDDVARSLADLGTREVTVEGHTDDRGSASRNDQLSQLRANAVRDYLTSHGLERDHIRAIGLGSTRPVADNRTADGRANNRRVEIVIAPMAATSPIATR